MIRCCLEEDEEDASKLSGRSSGGLHDVLNSAELLSCLAASVPI